MNTKISLSLVIHTKNEEANIEQCIMSVRDIVNEIVVVDMQSTDKTVTFAKKLGAMVYSVPDYKFADPVRNYAIEKTTNKWILILDADERIPKKLHKQIKEIIFADKFDVIAFPRRNIHFNKWIKHTGWWPDYQHRLFKKGYVSCPGVVHKRYEIKGRVLTLAPKEENSIVHFQTKSSHDFLERIDRYTALEPHYNNKKKITLEEIINYYEKEFFWRFFEQKGYLDGMRGFVLSKLMEFYRFLVFVKYWEKHDYPELCSPTQLKIIIEQKEQHSPRTKELNVLEKELFDKIINSKFYRMWRVYCNIKDMLLEKINRVVYKNI